MRAIFEALGAEVSWDNDTRTAIGKKGNVEVKITIGENVLYKNGEAITLDAPAEITNDRTMVPVRAISEAFGCTVNWDNDTKTVEIKN
ncbi:MAG: copper amine oxidase N-terminal domain-containing protein [Clostridia bacterium]|nr:copper amine oxidase N-terminal domain-containing protein [Clostridia bacterium]